MDDITDKLRMTQEMADALEADKSAETAVKDMTKTKEAARQKDLYDEAMERMKGRYWDNHKTQPRGMKGMESIPEMSAKEIDLESMMKSARKSAIQNKLGTMGRAAGKAAGPLAGLGLGMALEQETGPEEGSLSDLIEDPELPESSRQAAHEMLREKSGADDQDYFAKLREKKMERALAAKEDAVGNPREYPIESHMGEEAPEREDKIEADAFESKAARRNAILKKIREGQY